MMAPRPAPYVIGVAGGSGSGKTTVAEEVAGAMPEAVVIQHDAYYRDRPELSSSERDGLNFDHPDALETSLLVEHLRKLKAGVGVDVPIYDFSAHRRSAQSRRVEPAPVVVVEGILVLADEALRRRFDLKLFVDTEADVRVLRRIQRDIQVRGRALESVVRQYYATVRPMHLAFVEPSKRYADLVIPEGGGNPAVTDVIAARMRQQLPID